MPRVLFDKLRKLVRRTTVRQRTPCFHVRHQHFLIRTKHFRRLTHKVNATHHNDVRLRLGSQLGQRQTVTNVISDILYFTLLVVVPQNDCILFFLQLLNSLYEIIHNNILLFPPFKKNLLLVMIAC